MFVDPIILGLLLFVLVILFVVALVKVAKVNRQLRSIRQMNDQLNLLLDRFGKPGDPIYDNHHTAQYRGRKVYHG